jgi:hypothetical protein
MSLPIIELLDRFSELLRLLLEGLSLLCVLIGLLVILQGTISGGRLRPRRVRPASGRTGALPLLLVDPFVLRPSNAIRLTIGSWLAMALEFQLAADIVATTTAPSESNLIQLAVVAVIRTTLNLFLGRELAEERREEERAAALTAE